MTTPEKLLQLFPTPGSLTEVKKKYTSWKHMAKALGLSKASLYERRKVLGMKMVNQDTNQAARYFHDQLTASEIDANIKELVQGKGENMVTCYKITNMGAFEQDQKGYDNLELVGIEEGSNWGAISHKVKEIKEPIIMTLIEKINSVSTTRELDLLAMQTILNSENYVDTLNAFKKKMKVLGGKD